MVSLLPFAHKNFPLQLLVFWDLVWWGETSKAQFSAHHEEHNVRNHLCKHFFMFQSLLLLFGREKLVECFYSWPIQTNHEHFLQAADCRDHKQGLKKVLELLNFGKGYSGIAAVGHRVVHGGETLTEPTIITDSVKRAIEKAIPLAPLHNPPNLQVWKLVIDKWACFIHFLT
jgi:hypothetical protein